MDMPISYTQGDILLSRAPVLGAGINAQGMAEVTPFATALLDRYPAALAAFRKQARAGRILPGDLWLWRETTPWLALLVVRESAVGATRPRYVEEAVRRLARDWQREQIAAIALAGLGGAVEWPALRPVLDLWLAQSALPVVVYEEHRPGVRAPEPWDEVS